MLIRKVRMRALKACSVMDERYQQGYRRSLGTLHVFFITVFFFISLGGFM